jgi:hypothetical protein
VAQGIVQIPVLQKQKKKNSKIPNFLEPIVKGSLLVTHSFSFPFWGRIILADPEFLADIYFST